MPSEEHTCIELTGRDRPGLLSEVCAVLTDLECNVVNAEIWTHNERAAAVVLVTDHTTGFAIEDPKRLATIKELLCNVLRGNKDLNSARMTLPPPGATHRQRRLHQIMFADRDYEKVDTLVGGEVLAKTSRPHVIVTDCAEKDYTVITLRSKDRPKLLFDIICTLTDMQYVVFHGVVHTGRMEAYQVHFMIVCSFLYMHFTYYLKMRLNFSFLILFRSTIFGIWMGCLSVQKLNETVSCNV